MASSARDLNSGRESGATLLQAQVCAFAYSPNAGCAVAGFPVPVVASKTATRVNEMKRTLFPMMVVEDNPDDFYLLKRAFHKNEIRNPIHWLQDGLEAIEYLEGRGRYSDREKNPLPKVVVVDIKMPRLGGLELLGWIKSHPNLSLLPVLVMSSSNLDVDVARAYQLGANSFFVKPSTFDDLFTLTKTIHEYWVECVEPRKAETRSPTAKQRDEAYAFHA
jgi:CheY-like chemotaxis protein